MSSSKVHEAIESILELQVERSFMVAAFHLTHDQLRTPRDELTPDDPQVGAIGRCRNVPVFPSGAGRPLRDLESITATESHRGILFIYVKLDIVK